jgi:hypothetical protein
MTAPREVPSGRNTIAISSMVSVLLLIVMCAIYVAHGSPDSVMEGRPGTVVAVWYTVLYAAPYAYLVVRCLLADPSPAVLAFAKSLARAAIIGIVFIAVAGAIGFILFVMMIPNPLVYIGMVATEIVGQLQGAGFLALLALFAAQFPLQYPAGRAAAGGAAGDSSGAHFLGYATLLIPVFVFAHINSLHATFERRGIEKSKAEIKSLDDARKAAVDARNPIAQEVARTTLHVCVHSGCLDSLLKALKSQKVAIAYRPFDKGRFFAMVSAAEGDAPKYVTNETGVLVRLQDDHAPFGDVSYNTEYRLVDSTYFTLDLIRGCIRDELMSEWREYPLHLPRDVGCYMHGDTTLVPVSDHARYRVIYAAPRKPGVKLVKSFSLSMRPVDYGKPYVRSFLMTEDTTYVTTANRAARKTDPGLRGCEADSYYCGRKY